MKVFVNCITDDIKTCTNGVFDDGLGLKSVIYGVLFLQFSPHFKVFINIHEYKK